MQCPALGTVTPTGDDITIKATHTGITFLGKRIETFKELSDGTVTTEHKYETTGRFRKRYTGSKQCAVSLGGELYLDAKVLEAEIKRDGSKDKKNRNKKSATDAPARLNLSRLNVLDEQAQSSEIIVEPQKNQRKFCYSVNKREVRARLLGYINTQRGSKELYFWTVTFPAQTSDDLCYRIFNIWLTSLRKRHRRKDGTGYYPPMLKDYLWVAERQKIGTIHFHIAIPHRMDVKRANAMMRGTLKTFAKRCDIPYHQHSPQIAKYNGVDIAKHRTTKRVTNFAVKKGARALATYLSKYVTKNDAGIPNENGEIVTPGFTHLAWHNSRGFSCLFTGVTFTIKEFTERGFGPFLNRIRVFKMNFALFIPWLMGPPPLLTDHLYKLNSYIHNQLDNG